MVNKDISLSQRGFTLIELVVVVSIIGIIIATGFLSYTPRNEISTTRASAERLKWIIEQAIQESIIENKILGIAYSENGFFIAEKEEEEKEIVLNSDIPFVGDSTPGLVFADAQDWVPITEPIDIGIDQRIESLIPSLPWRINYNYVPYEEIYENRHLPVIIVYPNRSLYPPSSIDFLPQEIGDARVTLTWTTDGQVEIEEEAFF